MDRKISLHPYLDRFLDALAAICTGLSALSMIVLVATFGWLVYGRYVLNDTPTWVEQLALLMMITISFMSSATGVRERTHLAVDIIPMLCGAKSQLVLRMLCDFILLMFGFLMAIKSSELMQFSWYKEIPLLAIPEGIRYIPVLISGALVALFSAASLLGGAISLFSHVDPALNSDVFDLKNKAEE
ncbi:MAG: hypothetical protein OFPII_22840 [Osedax symbiont Rs1]|nr:MAG: hypothetical protein OFPII_22840 [Osedax symbiont Rs1]